MLAHEYVNGSPVCIEGEHSHGMLKKAVQQGRSE
jgi:hypothetical protein